MSLQEVVRRAVREYEGRTGQAVTLRQVAGGDRYVSSRLAFAALERRVETQPDPLEELTEREREILDLVSEGTRTPRSVIA
jgi:DNA-binding NarL/FixJ family response regulator